MRRAHAGAAGDTGDGHKDEAREEGLAFQATTKCISKHLRSMTLRMGCYLDDPWLAFKLRAAVLL